MRVYMYIVGVALARPPKVDEYRKVTVVAGSAIEAQILACQIAAGTSVMPVSAELVDPELMDMLDEFMDENDELLAWLARY